jgi:hypothetical protein
MDCLVTEPAMTARPALILLALAAAGGARAQTTIPKQSFPSDPPAARAPALPYAQRAERTSVPEGYARTSLDLRLPAKDLTSQVGFLCGLEPGPYRSGSPAASADPESTFLGGKLRLAFK